MEAKVNQLVDKKIQKALKKVAKPDYKVFNFVLPSTGFNYDSGAAYQDPCTGIAAGSSISTRIGNEIRLKTIRWALQFNPGDNVNSIRFLIVRSKGVGNVPTSASTMSANILSAATGSQQFLAPVDSLGWDVLHDELFQVHFAPVDGSTAATVGVPRLSHGKVSLGDVLIRYTQQASTVIAGRRPIILFLSDSAIAPNPTFQGYISMEWHDA